MKGPRYTAKGARAARAALLAELRRHGYARLARAYARNAVREKDVMSVLGCASIDLAAAGRARDAKVARGVALLAAFLHEGKHDRATGAGALAAFWDRLDRYHGGTR